MKRKYFDIQKSNLGTGQGPQKANAHWDLLEAYVMASCHTLGLDATADLLAVVKRKDAVGYLARGKLWLGHNSMYDPATPLEWVRTCRQAWSLLKKYPFSKDECSIDRKAVATEKFYSSERQCKATNQRLGNTRECDLPPFVHRARRIIDDVLDECNASTVMDIITMRGKHGKGSTCSNTGGRVTLYYKYADFPYTVTKSAANYALAAISANDQWTDVLRSSGRQKDVLAGDWEVPFTRAQSEMMLFSDCVDYAEDDVITFVPKDAGTDRSIAFGASLNLFLQLGVNDYMTECLLPFGVNLRDQSRNQRFAYLGSRYWERNGVSSEDQFSTLDLVSASGTIAIQAVKLLLRSDWFAFLSDLRHESGVLGEDRIVYEQFSAMGNGYTFPLESLIFWAVSKAAQEVEGIPVRQDDIAVYGDDIIVRKRGAHHVIEALEYMGFTINKEKSFVEGPFKESCGCDYFQGHDVRPIHLTRAIRYDADVYYLANRIWRLTELRGPEPGLACLYSAAVRLIPKSRRRYCSLSNSSDEALCVPLSMLSQAGIRPYLYHEEAIHLMRELKLDKLVSSARTGNQVPYEVHIESSATQYKGRVFVRKLMWLSAHKRAASVKELLNLAVIKKVVDEGWLSLEDILHKEAAASGQVTRRGQLERKWVVRAVPSWDGVSSRRSITTHPGWFMDHAL